MKGCTGRLESLANSNRGTNHTPWYTQTNNIHQTHKHTQRTLYCYSSEANLYQFRKKCNCPVFILFRFSMALWYTLEYWFISQLTHASTDKADDVCLVCFLQGLRVAIIFSRALLMWSRALLRVSVIERDGMYIWRCVFSQYQIPCFLTFLCCDYGIN